MGTITSILNFNSYIYILSLVVYDTQEFKKFYSV